MKTHRKTPAPASKRRGPPPTIVGKPQLVRMHEHQLGEIDAWASAQDEKISRPEAIRRLVELGLTVRAAQHPKRDNVKPHPDTKQRARELAGTAIDEMTDVKASREHQVNRKRRLISGPEEFQNVRRDRNRMKPR